MNKKSKKRKLHKLWRPPIKWSLFGLVLGVVLATVSSIGAMNGWFGGGGSIPEDTLTRGLVGYWAFEEASSTIAYDSSGYANNATTTNNPTWVKGKVGGAMEFDGDDDYLDVRDSDSLDITEAITLEAWVYDPPPVTDPTKKVKDEHTKQLIRDQGMDPDYVELYKDYGKRSEGKSPYARTYKDRQTGKYIMEVGGLPMVDADGAAIIPQWELQGNKFIEKNNLFKATVSGINVELKVKNDQPDGRKTNDKLSFHAQLFLNGVEQTPSAPVLLAVDPVNSNYTNNVLEWDYGIAKRRLRLIEGRVLGSWIFSANPNGDIRLVYNQTGDFRLNFGQYEYNNDEERVSAAQFNAAEYPFTVDDSVTFFPDAHPETNSADGYAGNFTDNGTWADITGGLGNTSADGVPTLRPFSIQADTSPDTGWEYLFRSITIFNTAELPDYATITAATVSLYGSAKTDGLLATPDVNMYGATPANNDAIVNADFSQVDSTALSTAISYANWSITGYNDFALNDLTKVSKTSQSKFGFRNANYDAAATAPNWVSGALSRLTSFASEQGAGYQPKLVITYTVPVAGIVAKGRTAYQLEIDDSLNVVGYINGQGVTTTVSKAWHHIAFTYDGSAMKIYQDGVLKDQAAATGAIATNNDNLKIGNLVPGKIDEVRIYNRALTAEEVRYHYNRGGPVAQWKFDEGEGRTAYDSTDNNNDGTLVLVGSATSSAWVAGKYGTALSFDGTNDYVDAGNVSSNARTVSFWLKRGDTSNKDVIDLGTPEIKVASNAITSTGLTSPTYYVNAIPNTTAVSNANQWYYITITDTADINASNVDIGKASSNYFLGLIDDVRIYNYARTPEEIRLDYNAGFAAKFGATPDCKTNPGSCMTQGLVGYWSMDEGAGGNAYDISDYGNHGSTSGGPTWTKGKVGGGLSFDGSNDYVEVPDSASLSPTQTVTVEVWLKSNQIGVNGDIVSKITGNAYLINIETDNKIRFYSGGSSSVNGAASVTTIAANTWYYVVGVYDGTDTKIYVNGQYEAKAATPLAPSDSSSVLRFGVRNSVTPDYYHNGLIDEVRVYNRVLSAEEIRFHYNRGAPVAQWKFDEGEGRTAYDTTDNNNDGTLVLVGSATSSAWVAGKYGSAISFDGTDDYVDAGSGASLNITSAITLEAWVRPDSIIGGSTNPVIDKWNIWGIRIQDTWPSYIYTTSCASAGECSVNVGTIPTNTWTHLVLTFDGTNIVAYKNGQETNRLKKPGTIQTSSNNVWIGHDQSGGVQYFDGLIDDVRIYNYARTPEEIRLDYNAGFAAKFGATPDCKTNPGSCMTQGLVGYWSMDEGAGGNAYDISDYGNHGSTSGGPTWTKGKVGGSLSFDGVNDYVDAGTGASLAALGNGAGDFSGEAWVKESTAMATGDYSLLAYGNTTPQWSLFSRGGFIRFYAKDTTGSSIETHNNTNTANNSWYHIAFTFTRATQGVKMYVNGALKNTGDSSALVGTGNAGLFIGQDSGWVRYWNGLIDEVRVYNRVLSAEEVRYHYNRGGPVAQWKFDEGEGRTAYDTTDNNNDGTLVLVGSATSSAWVAGKYGSALSFDGVNDWVNVANESNFDFEYNTPFSGFAWFKTTGTAREIFSKIGASPTYKGYTLRIVNNKLELILMGDNSTNPDEGMRVYTTQTVNDNVWHYGGFTYDGSNTLAGIKLYVDGVSATLTTFLNNPTTTTWLHNNTFRIGKNDWNDYWLGLIDDVRIYNYARTPEQILQDYNSGFSARFR